jgi:putative transposase
MIGPVKFKAYYYEDYAKKERIQLPIGRNKAKLHNPRVHYVNDKWIFSFVVAIGAIPPMICNSEGQWEQITLKEGYRVGIDAGIRNRATCSSNDGTYSEFFKNPSKSKKGRKLERQSKHLQRSISRKQRQNSRPGHTSKRLAKAQEKYRSICYKQANRRKDDAHKITRKIVNMCPEVIIAEDLNLLGILKDRHIARSISDAALFQIPYYLRYKAEEFGIEFIKADRFFPSSKLCSRCGNKKKNLSRGAKVYVCEKCGLVIDRDLNAARNLACYNHHPDKTKMSETCSQS